MSILHRLKSPFKVFTKRMITCYDNNHERERSVFEFLGLEGLKEFSKGSYGVVYRQDKLLYKIVRFPDGDLRSEKLKLKLYNNRDFFIQEQ